MRTLLINRPDRPSRLSIMRDRLDALEIRFDVLPAVVPPAREPFHTVGMRGAAMSHLMAGLLASVDEPTLVLEDDVLFHPDIVSLLRAALFEPPKGWDKIFLGIKHVCPEGEQRVSDLLWSVSKALHLHAYVLNPETVEKVRRLYFEFLNRPAPCHIDEFLNDDAVSLNRFCVRPTLAWQEGGWSDTLETERAQLADSFWPGERTEEENNSRTNTLLVSA